MLKRGFPFSVKCPKCGFVSFPGHEQCKKCGHRFTQVNGQVEGIPPLFHRPGSEQTLPSRLEPESPLEKTELGQEETGDLDVALEPQETASSPVPPQEEKSVPRPSRPSGMSPWQAELAERVQEYRDRRARMNKEAERQGESLNFEFGPSVRKPDEPHPNVIEFPSAEETGSLPKSRIEIRSAPPSFGMGSFESAFREEKEMSPDPPPESKQDSLEDSGPLEIELGPSEDSSGSVVEDDPSNPAIASMRMRFYAALVDAGVLLAGAVVYALIFRWVSGGFSPSPLDMAIAVVVGSFFVLLYSVGCTVMASATPGLMWAGLEVITFEGNPPTFSHCLWRGIGYLVSMSALLLGFIWAAVDAEGLTWHDRMSRTFIVPVEHR